MKKLSVVRTAVLALLVAAPAFGAPADDRPEALGSRAEYILDHWDGDPAQLAEAKGAIEEAVRLQPDSAHLQGIRARQVLLSGTTEEGLKPSALKEAHAILMHAAIQMQPPDARVFAFLIRVSTQVGSQQNRMWGKLGWAAHEAESLGPNDPWVDLALGEYSHQSRYFEKSLVDGLASPVELRKVLDRLLDEYLRGRQADKAAAAYERRAALDPADAAVRAHYAREVIVDMQDFQRGERAARDALAIEGDYLHARQSLSLALYGQWAQAARDRKGPDEIEALYRKAHEFDPGGHLIPTCLSDWGPLEFVYTRLEQKNVKREQMYQC